MAARRPRTRRQAVVLAAEDSADKIAEPERALVESLTSEEEPDHSIGKHFHLCDYLKSFSAKWRISILVNVGKLTFCAQHQQ